MESLKPLLLLVVLGGVGYGVYVALNQAPPARAVAPRRAELEQVASNRLQNRSQIRSCDTRQTSQRSFRSRDFEFAAIRRQLITFRNRKVKRAGGRRTSANSQRSPAAASSRDRATRKSTATRSQRAGQ